jgi:hypothetical protein
MPLYRNHAVFASHILMKTLYAARACRYDLLRAVCGLASCTTKWTHQCDRDLHRLICYINTTKEHAMIGWCGDPSEALELRVCADADFAGCVRTMRSTTGVILAVTGPNARMILNGVSKRQTAVSHSTPEAEIVTADYAMRAEGMPALTLLETILRRKVHLCVMEDNEAMIKICHSGKNPTMRYLNHTRKVGVSWLMNVFKLPEIDVCKIDAKLQAADIGTKRITCLDTWRSNCVLINLSEPDVDPTAQRALLCCRHCDVIRWINWQIAKRLRGSQLWNDWRRVPALPPILAGGVSRAKFRKKKHFKTNKIVYDDPSTHTCVCCEEFDTDCEPEYPCKIATSHCAICTNPWDVTCANDPESHEDEEDNDSPLCCMPCGPVGSQWYMQECDDTNAFDQLNRDIRDGFNSDVHDAIGVQQAYNTTHRQ